MRSNTHLSLNASCCETCGMMKCIIYDHAVHDTQLASLLQDAEGIARSPNFWLAQERILQQDTCTAAESVICQLYHSILRYLPGQQQYLGAEWWVQVYKPGKGLAFHFDKDEMAFKESGNMHHPLWSSVLYITGQSGPPTGPTVLTAQRFDNATRAAQPENPESSMLVWPRAGRYLLFDGALGHGVLDSPSHQKRVTMLINWWTDRQPQGVRAVTNAQLQQFGMSRTDRHGNAEHTDDGAHICDRACSRGDAERACACVLPAAAAHECAARTIVSDQDAQPTGLCHNLHVRFESQHQRESSPEATGAGLSVAALSLAACSGTASPCCQNTSQCVGGSGAATLPGRAASSKPWSTSQSGSTAEAAICSMAQAAQCDMRVLGGVHAHQAVQAGVEAAVQPAVQPAAPQAVPCVTCPAECVTMVDDLLEEHGWIADQRISPAALLIQHPGCALYPLDVAEQPNCVVAAALVPLSLMESEEGSSDDD